MQSVSDVIQELTGSGYSQGELIDISTELTELVISRKKIHRRLGDSFDSEELDHILATIEVASFQEQLMAKMFAALSPREKECYLLHTLESKSFQQIADELDVSKSAVQGYVTRAREKIDCLKESQG